MMFFLCGRKSVEATEGDERRKDDQSNGDFRNPRFHTFHWKEPWPIKLYLFGDLYEPPIQCVR
jgi:hypothetical protein